MPTVDGFGGAGGLGSGVTLSEGTVPSVGDGLGASDSLGSSLGSVSVGSGSPDRFRRRGSGPVHRALAAGEPLGRLGAT